MEELSAAESEQDHSRAGGGIQEEKNLSSDEELMVFMPPGMKPCKDKQEPEQLLKPVVFASSELGEVIKKDDDVQPEDDDPQSQGRHPPAGHRRPSR